MTRHKSFKQRVRARMSKTAESYTAARRQLLSRTSGADGAARDLASGAPATAGIHPATSAFRALLRAAGHDPGETALFAAGGGVGIGVFTFRYEAFSTFFLAGRHLWHDDLAFFSGLAERLGVRIEVRETGGRKKAARDLVELLERGPVIAFVDLGTLGYRGAVEAYYVVVVHEADEARGTARIADLADEPFEVDLGTLADARARHRGFRNRLVALASLPERLPQDQAVRDGLRACARGFDEPPVKGAPRNFTLDALDLLASRMRGAGKESWQEVFPPGVRRWAALGAIYEYVEHYGTGGGLLRPMFADALRDLGADPGLEAADAYDRLGAAWSSAAAAALPEDVAEFARLRELIDETYATYLAEGPGAAERLDAIAHRRAELVQSAFPLSDEAARTQLAELADHVEGLARGERTALGLLRSSM